MALPVCCASASQAPARSAVTASPRDAISAIMSPGASTHTNAICAPAALSREASSRQRRTCPVPRLTEASARNTTRISFERQAVIGGCDFGDAHHAPLAGTALRGDQHIGQMAVLGPALGVLRGAGHGTGEGGDLRRVDLLELRGCRRSLGGRYSRPGAALGVIALELRRVE